MDITLGALAWIVYREWMGPGGGRAMLVDRERNRPFMVALILGGWMASRILGRIPLYARYPQWWDGPVMRESWLLRFGRVLDTRYYGPGYNEGYYRTLDHFRQGFMATLPAALVAYATLAAATRYPNLARNA